MDLSRYRKILIYALTFLAYAWSGYGAGLLSNLRDAVLAAESVFHDLFANVITVAGKIKDIHEVFDAAVEENCVFKCSSGACDSDCDLIYQRRYQIVPTRRHSPILFFLSRPLPTLHFLHPWPLRSRDPSQCFLSLCMRTTTSVVETIRSYS